MNKEQQNKTIAKLMGARWVKSFNRKTPNKAVLVFVERLSLNYGDEIVYVNESDKNFTKVIHAHVPDYCNDLNAMHEAEKVLTLPQFWGYADQLKSIVDNSNGNASYISATASKRAEAFLKTLKLWKEQ